MNEVFARQDVQVVAIQGRAVLDVLDVVKYLDALSEVLGRDLCTAVAGATAGLEKEALIKRARMAGDQRFR